MEEQEEIKDDEELAAPVENNQTINETIEEIEEKITESSGLHPAVKLSLMIVILLITAAVIGGMYYVLFKK